MPASGNYCRSSISIPYVVHQAFLSVDEQGIEAAAAAAARHFAGDEPPTVSEVHVDHPFLFAVQDVANGACFFMGRVVDPR